MANLHNAKRARTPLINIVGDHAVDHLQYDAPLTSDVKAVTAPMSNWVSVSNSPDDLARLGARAIEVSMSNSGQIATVIAPADHAWNTIESDENYHVTPVTTTCASTQDLKQAAQALLNSTSNTALFLGGHALREDTLEIAGRIAQKAGVRLICETFPARLQRGVGRVAVERLPYFGELASEHIQEFDELIFIGAKPPVNFFMYPGKTSTIANERTKLINLADPTYDTMDALTRLANEINADDKVALIQEPLIPPTEPGMLTPMNMGSILAELMPDDAIVSEEAVTAGLTLYPMTQGAKKHEWMTVTGGAIGQGMPVGIGAAIACPERKVICLQADGSAMYTIQSLWTMARENLNITTVILNNSQYAILNIELERVGVKNPGAKALSMLDLSKPNIDWVSLSEGQGVPAIKVNIAEEFKDAYEKALAHMGPMLIEAIIPPIPTAGV